MTTAPNVLRWTHALYDQATAAGLFADRRVELIDGELYEMPPMNAPHIGATMYLETLFAPLLVAGRVRFAKPIILDQDGEPEPDIAVVAPGAPLKPGQAQVQLVIEVSDATREFDRGAKLQAYLDAGIAEIWIVDLVDREVLVYRAGALARVVRPGPASDELRPLAVPTSWWTSTRCSVPPSSREPHRLHTVQHDPNAGADIEVNSGEEVSSGKTSIAASGNAFVHVMQSIQHGA